MSPCHRTLSLCVYAQMQSDFVMGLFYGPAEFKPGTSQEVMDDHNRTTQMYSFFLITVMFLLACLSDSISLVPGACLGGGSGGVTFAALPHNVWKMATLLICFVSAVGLYFDSNNSVSATASWTTVGWWFHSILVIINFVHFIALILEIDNPNSTFWAQNGGAWVIVMLVLVIVYMILGVWIVWRLYVYRANLALSYEYGWRPGMLLNSSPVPERQQGDSLKEFEEEDNSATAPLLPAAEARIRSRIHVSGVKVASAQKNK